MRMFMKIVWFISALLLVGCGGSGSGTENISEVKEDTTSVYENKIMPVISESTVPDVFFKGEEVSNSVGNKSFKVSNTDEVESYGLRALQKNMRFFYAMQLEMNMNLTQLSHIKPNSFRV